MQKQKGKKNKIRGRKTKGKEKRDGYVKHNRGNNKEYG